MTKTKAQFFNQQADSPPDLIRWLMILTTIGLVSSFAIGLLLKRQPANAQSNSVSTLLIADRATH